MAMDQRDQPKKPVCQICGQAKPEGELLPATMVRDSIVDFIQRRNINWSPDGYICEDDLTELRAGYIQDVLETERGELTALDLEVVKSLQEEEFLARNVEAEFERKLTFGERLSDNIASFGGSWRFIIIFGAILLCWITLNSIALLARPFDPYPFILLNLVLSCLAALQAPIIMMSQNRQEVKDRLRGENDYRINLKAELEIRHLQEKVDHLLKQQWQRLLEIQQIQMDLMQEITKNNRK
jgi:uncharacterized membrane protein